MTHKLGLDPKKRLRDLSKGDTPVALAWPWPRPEVLILDEPTSGLDLLTRRTSPAWWTWPPTEGRS